MKNKFSIVTDAGADFSDVSYIAGAGGWHTYDYV